MKIRSRSKRKEPRFDYWAWCGGCRAWVQVVWEGLVKDRGRCSVCKLDLLTRIKE